MILKIKYFPGKFYCKQQKRGKKSKTHLKIDCVQINEENQMKYSDTDIR